MEKEKGTNKMKGTRYHLNIDRLEVCYTAPKEVMDKIEDTSFWQRDGYRLVLQESNKIETILKIEVQDYGESGEYSDFAWLRIGNKFEKEDDASRYCWVRMNNKALYAKGREYGELSSLYWIADDLGLEFHNITEIEIALDANINWFKRVRAALRSEELVPIVLGKAYPERKEVISKLLYLHTGDRVRYRTNSLVAKSGNGDISLKLYDKGAEIEESEKGYIRECFGLNSGGLFRSEVKAYNRALSDFCCSSGLSQYDIYMRLIDGGLLFDLFLFYCNKLLRFKEKRTLVSIVQL